MKCYICGFEAGYFKWTKKGYACAECICRSHNLPTLKDIKLNKITTEVFKEKTDKNQLELWNN